MIESILALLELDECKRVSERVDIAKGKYKLNTSFREAWNQRKRKLAWQ